MLRSCTTPVLLVGQLCLAACAGSTEPKSNSSVLSIKVDPPVIASYPGEFGALSAVGYDANGSPVAGTRATFKVDVDSIASVDRDGHVMTKVPGTANVKVSMGSASTFVPVYVLGTVSVAVGGTTTFSMPQGVGPHVAVSLSAGDTIDAGIWVSAGGVAPQLTVGGGSLPSVVPAVADPVASPYAIYPMLVATASGTYVFTPSAGMYGHCPPPVLECGWTASGTVRVRRAASIVSMSRRSLWAEARQGEPASDTLSLTNLGAGVVPISIAAAPSWLTISPATAQLTGPRALHASATQRFTASFSTGQAPGEYTGSLVFGGIATDDWTTNTPYSSTTNVGLRVDDAGSTAVPLTKTLIAIAVSPTHALYGVDAGTLYRVEASSGALTSVATLPTAYNVRLTVGLDSVVYVTEDQATGATVLSLDSTGHLVERATIPLYANIAVDGKHTLYAASGRKISWRRLDGSDSGSVSVSDGVQDGPAIDGASGCLFYTGGGSLARWCPGDATDTPLTTVLGPIGAARDGYIYTVKSQPSGDAIIAYDPNGHYLDTRWPMDSKWIRAVAVDSGTIFALTNTSLLGLPVKRY